MYSDFSEKLASLIVNYSVKVQPGDTVLMQSPINAEPLVREIYREIIQAGGHVVRMDFSFNGQTEIFYKYASEEQLKYENPFLLEVISKATKLIAIYSEYNTKGLTNVDPEKKKIFAEARKEISRIYTTRAAKKELYWNLSPYPCDAFAQEANMGKLEYLEFVYKALNLHQPDPVKFWTKVQEDQEKITVILDKGSELRIIGKDTDLILAIEGRKWINSCGERNLPDGEVHSSAHENGVNGKIRFTYPGIYQGQEIEDIRLSFRDGMVIDYDAAKGKKLLEELLTISNANVLGEVAIGTNYGIQKFTKNMLFDEKMGGTVHLALGSGYPDSGSKNESSIHWDILKDMKDPGSEIRLDGEVIYREGKWLIP
ncbi:MAG: aminopeptidase [Candidatus Odinarchaeota archaeon]